MCLAYIVTCVPPLQVVVLLCTLLYSTVQSTVVTVVQAQDVRSKHKSSDVASSVLYFLRYCSVRLKMFSLFFCVCVCVCYILFV